MGYNIIRIIVFFFSKLNSGLIISGGKKYHYILVFPVFFFWLNGFVLASEKNVAEVVENIKADQELIEAIPDSKEVAGYEKSQAKDNFIDRTHSAVKERVSITGKWIDSFFVTERYEEEENETSLILKFTEFVDENGSDFKARAKVRIRTPNLNKRLKFFIIGEEGDVDPALSDAELVEQAFESTDEDSVSAGFFYSYRETLRKNIKLKGGFRFRNNKVVSFVEPRFRWREDLGLWNAYFTQKAGWFSDNGFNAKTRLDFDLPLTSYHMFRASFSGDWYENLEGYYYNLGVQYNHLLGGHKGLSYQWNNAFFLESESYLSESVFRVAYRQRFWREWLVFEVAPQIKYPREEDFEATPGLFLKVEIRFDNKNRNTVKQNKLNDLNTKTPDELKHQDKGI